ncbi:RNase P subunit p29-like protein [Ramaria rubella]|nr:RNase P subunit p29-like protein [Ramaria rubella]
MFTGVVTCHNPTSMDNGDTQARTAIDPYRELPQGQHLRFTTSAPFTPTYVQSLLTSSTDPSTIYASRVQNRQLPLENPAKESRTKQLADQRKARQAHDAARRKSRGLSRRDAAVKGVWGLRKEETRYELFLPLHRLWKSYVAELLGLNPRLHNSIDPSALRMPNAQGMQAKLVKADFHGSIVSVRSAKNPCLVGCSGIVIHETENTFKVVTMKNKLKVIPKHNSVFVFTVPLYIPPSEPDRAEEAEPMIEFELYGDQFAFRSSDRATRKFKHKLVR